MGGMLYRGKHRNIPVFVQRVYAYNNIPEVEWQEHYNQDCTERGVLTIKARQTYEWLYWDIFNRRLTCVD